MQKESNHWNRKLYVALQSQGEVEIPLHWLECTMADISSVELHGNFSTWMHLPVIALPPDCLLGCIAFSPYLPVPRRNPGDREYQCFSARPLSGCLGSQDWQAQC